MNRIDYSSSVMNSPPKLHLPFEQVKNTIQYSNSEIYQPQAIEHDFLSMLSNIFNKIHLK